MALFIEQLERRALLSGNVTAEIVMGDLLIWGDNVANDIVIDAADLLAGQVRVSSGSNVTTINGLPGPVLFEIGAESDIIVQLRHGPDTLVIRDITIPDDLVVQTGLGMDSVTLRNVTVDDAIIRTGTRADTVMVDDTTFNGEVLIDTKWGQDSVRIEQNGDDEGVRSFFNGPVEILTKRGNDDVRIGLDANTGNRAVFYSTLRLDGGVDYDELRNGDGNWYDIQPLVQQFEYSEIAEIL